MFRPFRGEWYSQVDAMDTAKKAYKKTQSLENLERYKAAVNTAEEYLEKKQRVFYQGCINKETTTRRSDLQLHKNAIKVAEFDMLFNITKVRESKYIKNQTEQNLTIWHTSIEDAHKFQQDNSAAMEADAESSVLSQLGAHTREKKTYDEKHSTTTFISNSMAKVNKSSFWCCCASDEEVEDMPLNELDDNSNGSYAQLNSEEEERLERRQANKHITENIRNKYGFVKQ